MMRRVSRWWLLAAATLGGCSGPEAAVISKFFLATASKDNASLAGISTVAFPGEAESWKVAEVVADRNEPFRMAELRQNVEAAQKARDEQFEQYNQYRADNAEGLRAVEEKLAKDPAAVFTGKQAELAASWRRLRAERAELEGKLNEAKRGMEAEAELARKSLLAPVSTAELQAYGGEVRVREVKVQVRGSGGEEKPYTFTLRKYDLVHGETGARAQARWIITAIQ